MVLEATRVTPLNAMFKIYPREKIFTVQIAKCAQTLIEVPQYPVLRPAHTLEAPVNPLEPLAHISHY
jgi:hypothetical protein